MNRFDGLKHQTEASYNVGKPMPLYRSYSEVLAVKIKAIDPLRPYPGDHAVDNPNRADYPNRGNLKAVNPNADWIITPEEIGYAPFTVSADYINKYHPVVGGYYVVDRDGNESFSAATDFEGGFSRQAIGGGYAPVSLHPNKKSAAEHRAYVNSYRQTAKPPVVVPALVAAPVPGAEYPKQVIGGDGVKRVAYDAQHEADLKAIGKSPVPLQSGRPKQEDESLLAYRRAASNLSHSLQGEPHVG